MSDQTPPTGRIQIFKSKIEWSVERCAFDTPPEGSVKYIESNAFFASPDTKVVWQLHLSPRGVTDDARDYVGLYLCAWNIKDPIRVKYKLGLIARDGTENSTTCGDVIFSKRTGRAWSEWGQPKLIRRDVLLDTTKNYFRGNQLDIFCDLEVHWNLEVQVPESSICGHDRSELLESGEFSDVVLVVGGEEIKAHKNVLAAGSPVFEAMFKYNMTENQSGRVLIEDLDVVGVKALLNFIYSEEVNDLKANAEKVLPAAGKYGLDRLKIICEKEICKKLAVENVVDILRLAELHTAKQLKAQALSFIISNKADVVEQVSFWRLNSINQDLFEEVVELSFQLGNEQVKRKKLN